jgi:hypothetical protein
MMRRTSLLALAATLLAGAAMAAAPGARYETRMVYDTKIQRVVLFGGLTAVDAGTKVAYDLNDTWEWNGLRWFERFTPVAPPARSSHTMVFDTKRQRTLVFGGKHGNGYINDTWQYRDIDGDLPDQGGVWSEIQTATAPPARVLGGGAYDSDRDRFVLFGGTGLDSAQAVFAYHDTWEFDGSNWTQVQATDAGPKVNKPIVAYDRKRKQVVMLGVDDSLVTKMYIYDGAAHTWTERKPANLPPCANESMLTYDTVRELVVLTGGTCATSGTDDETYEWNGDDWTKVTLSSTAGRVFGGALAFDEAHNLLVLYGGYFSTTGPRYQTYLYANGIWASTPDDQPVPRSLFPFATDPVNKVIYLFGGTVPGSSLHDLWKYQNGHFEKLVTDTVPASCTSPLGTYDLDRKKLVLFCGLITNTYEYDVAANTWANVTPSKDNPPVRSFSGFVYDQHLQRVVMFGGYNGNFLDDTWTWDGKVWTQVKKNPPPSRSLPSMWYDPIQQRTVLFGGLGRLTADDRITRYNDMWAFDGTGWTELKPTALPGTRYGASVGVDPRNGHALLFGGLQVTGVEPTQVQSYANDTWEWDGANWTQLTTNGAPDARENAGFAFDPSRNEMVLFGGYGGHYFSDVWTLNGTTWRPFTDTPLRRRAAGR